MKLNQGVERSSYVIAKGERGVVIVWDIPYNECLDYHTREKCRSQGTSDMLDEISDRSPHGVSDRQEIVPKGDAISRMTCRTCRAGYHKGVVCLYASQI